MAKRKRAAKKAPSGGKQAATRARKTTKKTARSSATRMKKAARPVSRKKAAKKTAGRKSAAKKAAPRKAAKRAVAKKGAPRRAASAKPKSAARPKRVARPTPVRETIPSSLDLDQSSSAAKSGRKEMLQHLREANKDISPAITAGDLDANWQVAYSSGDEAPGGDNPTPDQDVVDDIGRALGIEYESNEELKGAVKLEERDRHRWELDPASAEDYPDHEE
jgi:Family of unknown function (DUF6335)